MVSSKKTAESVSSWQVINLPQEHRRLRFSFQINDFKDQDRKNRPHCFTPVSGGGGDIVASEVRVNQFFRRTFRRRHRPESRRRRRCSRLRFLRQAVLSKELLSAFPPPGGRRRRLPKESQTPCQPGFSAISRTGSRASLERKKSSGEKP